MMSFRSIRPWIQPAMIAAFTAFIISASPVSSLADISPETYCELTIKHLEQTISHLEELISIAKKYSSDSNALTLQESLKQTEFQKARNELFASYGMTDKAFAVHMGKHGSQVKEYLNYHPDIQQEIDGLSSLLRSLVASFETMKGSR